MISMHLLFALGVSLGINISMFIVAYLWKTDKLTDASYAITFVVLSLTGLFWGGFSAASIMLTVAIMLWAARLGGFLFMRIRKQGKDSRFDEMRDNFWKFGRFWVLQGFSVWLILLPSLFFLADAPASISIVGYVGLLIWGAGLAVETVADVQKYAFNSNPQNAGTWIESGIWKYSRHPNYFGEICVWVGIYVFTLSGLSLYAAVLGMLSPLYIASLLLFVSGIPILEKAADQKWGDNPAYQSYKRETSVLIPWFTVKN